tara:strand:- start:1347 stop:2426 length:1080 start_codon:yes stop_codon:yes gene_type:complete
MIKKYQKYLINVYIKTFIIVMIIFFGLSFVLNLFEELKFFEKYNVGTFYPLILTALNTPSIILELLPFITLISSMFFFIFLNDRNEIEILIANGINYLKVLFVVLIMTGLIGIISITAYYTLAAKLKSNYLIMKNKYTAGNEYLAIVNDSGLWIKEEINGEVNIINAQNFKENILENITISKLDNQFKTNKVIISPSGDVSKNIWKIKNAKIYDKDGSNKSLDKLEYNSNFNGEMISNLFSNLNSLNLLELHNLSKTYKKIGYSTTEIKIHLNKMYSIPLYIILMAMIGSLVMLRLKQVKSKFFVIIIGVFLSVIVYYINYFSILFGENEVLPVEISVWVPHLLLLLVCSLGMVRINEI